MDDLLDLNFNSAPSASTLKPASSSTSFARSPNTLFPSSFNSPGNSSSANHSRAASPAIPPSFDFLSGLTATTSSNNFKQPIPTSSSGSNYLSATNSLTPTPLRSNTPNSESPIISSGSWSNTNTGKQTTSGSTSGSSSKGTDAFADLFSGAIPPVATGASSAKASPYNTSPSTFPTTSSSGSGLGTRTPLPSFPISGTSTPLIPSQRPTSSTSTIPNQRLTLAQQQAQLQSDKRQKEEREKAAFDFDVWGGGGALGGGTTGTAIDGLANGTRGNTMMDTFGLDLTSSLSSSSRSAPLTMKPGMHNGSSSDLNAAPNVFDLLSGPDPALVSTSSSRARNPPGTSRTVRESNKAQAHDKDENEEDILGLLGQPAGGRNRSGTNSENGAERQRGQRADLQDQGEMSPRSSTFTRPEITTSTSRASTNQSQSRPQARHPSPPPHILGRIVEMGFSPAQARKALARTGTGLDVEAALEVLLNGGAKGPEDGEEGKAGSGNEGRNGRGSAADVVVDAEEEARERRRRRRQGPSRASTVDSEPARDRNGGSSTKDDDILSGNGGGDGPNGSNAHAHATEIADQADKIMAQASEIGLSMFNKANSLWSVGKEKARVMYEERAAAAAKEEGRRGVGSGERSGASSRQGGKPRWMIDAEDAAAEEEGGRGEAGPSRGHRERSPERERARGFQDSDDEVEGPEEALPQRPTNGRGPPRKSSPTRSARPHPQQQQRIVDEPPARADLLDRDTVPKTGYRSPARRRPMDKPTASRPPAPPKEPLKVRPVEPIPADRVQRSAAHKTQGNDHFKLGKFAEASVSYTSAITALPAQHILTIPLYNNRATSLLKSGDHSGAVSDCTVVIDLIGPQYHPSREEPLSGDVKDVKLSDALFKAYSKRAGAFEMGEKWDKAKEDWETLMTLPAAEALFAGPSRAMQRKMVSEGLARSRKMCAVVQDGGEDKKISAHRPAVKPRPKPATKATSTAMSTAVEHSDGVNKMREAAQAAEKEDDLRLSLKDSVDGRLSAWSKGKESNIRGLLSSLDMVLWDGLGFKKVGMADLLTEKQVKIAYMRVIAKLHPDKLSVSTTTLEQRMLANGAFGTLNEAWKAFLSSA